MIDRLAALADIVPPQPVTAPPVSAWWLGPWVWVVGGALLLALAAGAPRLMAMVSRRAARRRLERLARRIRGGVAPRDVQDTARRLLAAAHDAGVHMPGLPAAVRARCDALLYARAPDASLLLALLDDLVGAR